MNFNKIKVLLTQRRATWVELAEAVGQTDVGLKKSIEKGTMSARNLEAVASFFGMSAPAMVAYLSVADDAPAPSVCEHVAPGYARPKFIEERIEELERRLKALEGNE
jgi:hypothetical protein